MLKRLRAIKATLAPVPKFDEKIEQIILACDENEGLVKARHMLAGDEALENIEAMLPQLHEWQQDIVRNRERTGLGICGSCRWRSGCHKCAWRKLVRYYLRRNAEQELLSKASK